jgi:tetratricopeptide (TPR) repeat protein
MRKIICVACFSFLCVFWFIPVIIAQRNDVPKPEMVKNWLRERHVSNEYIDWNYHINGKQPTGKYDGPYEGGPPNPQIIKRNIKEYLPQQIKYIDENPLRGSLYNDRGSSYAKLYEITENPDEQASYAERALTDFNKAIELEPGNWEAFINRAKLLKTIDFFAYFKAVTTDYLTAIRLIDETRTQHPDLAEKNDSKVPELFLTISSLYWNRAKALSSEPKLLKEVRGLHKQYFRYSYWNDFDTALDYAYKGITKPNEVWVVINYFVDKGDAAYKLGEYRIALDAYTSGKRYWDMKSAFYCASNPTLCDSDKKHAENIFNNKQAKVYMQLGEWDKALIHLDRYLDNTSNTFCPEPFLMRARIYKGLNKTALASADEQKAKQLQISSTSCYSSAQEWK